jgi:hypothetical protein
MTVTTEKVLSHKFSIQNDEIESELIIWCSWIGIYKKVCLNFTYLKFNELIFHVNNIDAQTNNNFCKLIANIIFKLSFLCWTWQITGSEVQTKCFLHVSIVKWTIELRNKHQSERVMFVQDVGCEKTACCPFIKH